MFHAVFCFWRMWQILPQSPKRTVLTITSRVYSSFIMIMFYPYYYFESVGMSFHLGRDTSVARKFWRPWLVRILSTSKTEAWVVKQQQKYCVKYTKNFKRDSLFKLCIWEREREREREREKKNSFRYMELQSTKFILIGQAPG